MNFEQHNQLGTYQYQMTDVDHVSQMLKQILLESSEPETQQYIDEFVREFGSFIQMRGQDVDGEMSSDGEFGANYRDSRRDHKRRDQPLARRNAGQYPGPGDANGFAFP